MCVTVSDSSLLITRFPDSSCSYPNKYLGLTCVTPLAILFLIPHLTFSLMDFDSSCAIEANIVKIISILVSLVVIFSFSKKTSTPLSLNSLTILKQSIVFLANLDIDFVNIKSILPARASSIISWNPFLFLIEVPEIPSSEYNLTNSQSGFLSIRDWYSSN